MKPFRWHWAGITALGLTAVGQLSTLSAYLDTFIPNASYHLGFILYGGFILSDIAMVLAEFWAIAYYRYARTRSALVTLIFMSFITISTLLTVIQIVGIWVNRASTN